MAGPSLSGPLNGWTASTLAPQLTNLPVSPAAAARALAPAGLKSFPTQSAARQLESDEFRKTDLARRKTEAAAAEKLAQESGKPADLQAALKKQLAVSAIESQLAGVPPLDAFKASVTDFKSRNPTLQLTSDQERSMALSFQPAADRIADAAFSAPTAATFTPSETAASSSGGNLSQYDLTAADYGVGGPDPRAAKPNQTPLESLLASIYPTLAAGAPADPLADPRAPTSNSTLNNVLSGLAQQGSGAGWVSGGPSLSGPQAGPSFGANLAATIPGAPPFLAGAINGVQQFNPYAQRPTAPQVAAGGGFDPLIGLSAISAEQRIQAAQMAKDKAAAQAKWFKSQADQEQMRADQANMSRLKGFSSSGWSPALPTY